MPDTPDYGLYGEPAGAGFPDLLHIERLRDRSGPRRWRIARHRHPSLHQIFWIGTGGGVLHLGEEEADLAGPMVINLPAGVVHGFRFLPGTQGHVLTLPVSVFEPLREQLDPLGRLGLAFAVPPDAPDQDGLPAATLPELLLQEHGRRPAAGAADTRAAALTALASLACLAALRAAEAARRGETRHKTRAASRLLARFLALVDRRLSAASAENGPLGVGGCATALAVTPTHLSRVCREQTGKPASALLRERQMLEARRLLAYTQQDVAGIAWRVGYADPAYFSRLFSTETGQSPRAFRRAFSRSARP